MPPTEQVWFHEDRIGRYLPKTIVTGSGNVATPVMICPDDQEPAARSYAMNIWASSAVDSGVKSSSRGTLWGSGTKGSANLILITEKWSGNFFNGAWFSSATVGFQGDRAGQRFGAGGGVSPPLSNGRFGNTITEVDYVRHRRRTDGGKGTEPIGRINIGFADGHVQSFRHTDLADFTSPAGKSKLVALWSLRDRAIP
jgi:prepilin-type processing-associated H-X9-DG protein